MRFFYYYPTWTAPSGGNKQLRLMATMLRELGVETFLVRDRKFFAPGAGFDDDVFYSVPVPLAPFAFEEAGAHLRADDVLILPEVLLKDTLPTCAPWRCRIALNNQNGFYSLGYRPSRRLCADRIEFAIANAPYVASICKDFFGIPPTRIFQIPYWVARPPFGPVEGGEARDLAICYMPRKLAGELGRIRENVLRTHPDVPWVEVDGVPEQEVARRIRQHSIFLSTQHWEGFGLPALEAMACDCLVVGYAGTRTFPHPYALPENGLWVPDGDVEAASSAVGTAIEIVRRGGEPLRSFVEAGREMAARFSKEPVRRALAGLIDTVGDRTYAQRRPRVDRLGLRNTLAAYRVMYDYDRLGWPGRLVSEISRATKPLRMAFNGTRP